MFLFAVILSVQAYRSSLSPSELGHSAEEIEVDDDGTLLADELGSLNSRLDTVTAKTDALPVDCKWFTKVGSSSAKAKSIVAACPSTYPVLVSGGGSCYNWNPICDVTGQKVKTSQPSTGSPSGYINAWEITCDKPAKDGCQLPLLWMFCCSSSTVRTNLPSSASGVLLP